MNQSKPSRRWRHDNDPIMYITIQNSFFEAANFSGIRSFRNIISGFHVSLVMILRYSSLFLWLWVYKPCLLLKLSPWTVLSQPPISTSFVILGRIYLGLCDSSDCTVEERSRILEKTEYNMFSFPSPMITVDYFSDSGSYSKTDVQWCDLMSGD